MTTEAEYTAWRLDSSRDQHRVLLVEMDHSAGTVHLASSAWMSEAYQPYDDWIVGQPEIEESLEDFLGVGDVDAINEDRDDTNWLSLNFRGYRCRWYFGDDEWNKADFRRIATALIDGVRAVSGKHVRFDLMDGGQQLNRTFVTGADMTSTISAPSTIENIMIAAGLPPVVVFDNVSNGENAFMVNVTYTEDTIAAAAIKSLSDTMGAYTRFSQEGVLEVFIPEITATPVKITDDDIAYSSVRMVELIQPYKKATAKLFDDTEVSIATTATTGELDEEIIFSTDLRVTAHATAFATKKALYYSDQHITWELAVFDVDGLIQKGIDVDVDSIDLIGTGIVTRLRRSPLSSYTIVEVTI